MRNRVHPFTLLRFKDCGGNKAIKNRLKPL